jgi:tetratricopeptide (TPR) repeat protein
MKEQFEGISDYKKEEQKLLKELGQLPPSANKSAGYIQLGLLLMESGDLDKAEIYLNKAQEELKQKKSFIGSQRLSKAQKELKQLKKQMCEK